MLLSRFRRLPLAAVAMAFLVLLVDWACHADRPVTRSLIIEHVWDIHFDSVSNVVATGRLMKMAEMFMCCGLAAPGGRRRDR
ncbi:MAG: hypothetical protein B7Z72_05130 [Gemmatimonadetes bacterium 21-71-4]|nr:MAG: hypothetical protein B7Z72_05130 [Gemmatimonadetes bacterium 21-71-4]